MIWYFFVFSSVLRYVYVKFLTFIFPRFRSYMEDAKHGLLIVFVIRKISEALQMENFKCHPYSYSFLKRVCFSKLIQKYGDNL